MNITKIIYNQTYCTKPKFRAVEQEQTTNNVPSVETSHGEAMANYGKSLVTFGQNTTTKTANKIQDNLRKLIKELDLDKKTLKTYDTILKNLEKDDPKSYDTAKELIPILDKTEFQIDNRNPDKQANIIQKVILDSTEGNAAGYYTITYDKQGNFVDEVLKLFI